MASLQELAALLAQRQALAAHAASGDPAASAALAAQAMQQRNMQPNVPDGYQYGQWGPSAPQDDAAAHYAALQAEAAAKARADQAASVVPHGGPLLSGSVAANPTFDPVARFQQGNWGAAMHPQLPAQASPVAQAAVAEHHDANSGETHPDFGTPGIHPANDPAHPFRRGGHFKPGLFRRSGGDRARALTY